MVPITAKAESVTTHADGPTQPLRPASVCQSCWEGPFAAHLGVITHITSASASTSTLQQPPSRRLEMLQIVRPYRYSVSAAALRSGVGKGCQWCGYLQAMCDGPEDGLLEVAMWGGSTEPRAMTNLCITPDKTQELRVIVNGETRFTGYVCADEGNPAGAHIVARRPIADVRSPRALALVLEHIEECARGHLRCRAIQEPCDEDPLLPTRLIDCTDPSLPRLVSTRGGRGRYIALSYVWGEAQPHSTTTLNVSAYEHGIRAAGLPATIRDAIYVTHALGARYLWADTLCIIQDSDADKRRELGRMHSIYRDAHLTVIAASARRVGEGFLQERPVVSRTECGAFPYEITLPFVCPPRTSTPTGDPDSDAEDPTVMPEVGEVHLVPTRSHGENSSRPIEQYSHMAEPISGRGWCMQEYMMSPRSLIFTSETLQYRCQTATQNVGRSFYDPNGERRLHDALFLRDPPVIAAGSYEWDEVHAAWLRLVEDYSRRSVSVPSDKLVACGAIAEAFRRVLRSDYVAGLWRATLPCDLLWARAEEGGPGMARPARNRAPSWSWAAVDGGVAMPRSEPNPIPMYVAAVEVVRCEVALEDAAAPFGQVTGGILVLRGALLPCVLETPSRIGRGNCEISLQALGCASCEDGVCAVDRHGSERGEAEGPPYGWACIDVNADLEHRTAWAIPLERSDWAVQGLVVAPAESGEVGQGVKSFRRLGCFHIKGRDDGGLRRALQEKKLPFIEVQLV